MFTLDSFNQSTRRAFVYNIGGFLIIQFIITIFIFGFGLDKGHNPAFIQKPYVAPPGALVAIVWLSLFFLMAYSRWYLNRFSNKTLLSIRTLITALLIWCCLYPLYTFAIDSAYGGLVGNAGIFFFSSYIIGKSWRHARIISFLILPVLLWIVFATTIILSELGYL